jgi:hypothetical protein
MMKSEKLKRYIAAHHLKMVDVYADKLTVHYARVKDYRIKPQAAKESAEWIPVLLGSIAWLHGRISVEREDNLIRIVNLKNRQRYLENQRNKKDR